MKFSPLWRCCEARASMFKCGEGPRNYRGGPVNPVEACLRLRDTVCSLILIRKYYLPFLRAGTSYSTQ